MPHVRFMDREQLMDELLATLRANPEAATQHGMAEALGISTRTLARVRHELHVPWPPLDRRVWQRLVREAHAQRPGVSSWLITCRVVAPSLGDAEAKLLADDGSSITIIEAKRLESATTRPVA